MHLSFTLCFPLVYQRLTARKPRLLLQFLLQLRLRRHTNAL